MRPVLVPPTARTLGAQQSLSYAQTPPHCPNPYLRLPAAACHPSLCAGMYYIEAPVPTLPRYRCSPPLATTLEYIMASCARRSWPPPLCHDCCGQTTLTAIPLPHPSIPCPEYRQYRLPRLGPQAQGCPGICARPHWPPLPSMSELAALAVVGLRRYATITAVKQY